MAKIASTWQELYACAGKFGLDMVKFGELEKLFNETDPEIFAKYASLVPQDNFPSDEVGKIFSGSELYQFLLLCTVANRPALEELYREKGYPEYMLKEISADLPVWLDTMRRDINTYGLAPRNMNWAMACLTGWVIPHGRLQSNNIHFFTENLSIYRNGSELKILPAFTPGNPPSPDLTRGDRVINMHIPASGPLKTDDCKASFRRMKEFFNKFAPDYGFKALVCTSWMLDPQYQELLPESSNIRQFQKLGHLISLPERDTTEGTMWRIWGDAAKNLPPDKLPANTSLEKAVRQHLLNGGKMHSGLLVIFPDEI